jgi:hypothetical protein
MRFWGESRKESYHYKELIAGRRIILERVFEKWNGAVWPALIWFRIGVSGKALVNTVKKLRVQ